MSALLLSTPTNPGTASWASSNEIIGRLQTNVIGDAGPLVLPTTEFPLAGVTIPANTLVDGAAVEIQSVLFFDTSAASAPAEVCLGLSINGQTTQGGTGITRYIQIQPGLIYGGGIINICAIFIANGNQFVITGMAFLDETSGLSTTNGQTRLINANVTVDPSLPCPIFPVVLPVAADPGILVSAGQFAVNVRLP